MLRLAVTSSLSHRSEGEVQQMVCVNTPEESRERWDDAGREPAILSSLVLLLAYCEVLPFGKFMEYHLSF